MSDDLETLASKMHNVLWEDAPPDGIQYELAEVALSFAEQKVEEAEREFLLRCEVFASLVESDDMKTAAQTIAHALLDTIEQRQERGESALSRTKRETQS